MVNIGILGFSPENGHPYSFSAIINGYDSDNFNKTEWTGILNYLEKRDTSEIAELDAKVTHIWTQTPHLSQEIADCCHIEHVVEEFIDMIGHVDGVIIARDDYELHLDMAKPFLDAGVPVFIDKPLTLSREEMNWYKPYYEKGLLMSCSGLRHCQELDIVRNSLEHYGDIRLVRAAVINGWDKYGIHMLDATLGIWDLNATTIQCTSSNGVDSYIIDFESDIRVQIDTLGPDVVTFSYEVFGTKQCQKFEIRDNFSSFKRTLKLFIEQVKTREPAIGWQSLNRSISILIAGRKAKASQSKVLVKYE
ncbi:Gfo/Idh/MocA family oxidoreductase [Vibrio cyclitrophicus]|nr:Gfo/Idh/MocA family oxidoreductase [Vibrio cyclitrophicus]UPR33117.1 Gfo/Idh/MocA family oxidoreductase [Vibrio cyclitrophicus]